MNLAEQAAKAELLRKLHYGPRILILPNAWDAISALIVEDARFPAVATTSAGVAAALGYPDGQRVQRDEMLEAVARIARVVKVPVTADLEAGYANTPREIADFARATIATGVVGLNFEDVTGDDEASFVELNLQVEKIAALREAANSAGVPLVINARTDIYLLPIGPEESRFDRTVLLQPGGATVRELEKLGVARASAGSGPHRSALTRLREVAVALREYGDHTPLFEHNITWSETNRLLGRSE